MRATTTIFTVSFLSAVAAGWYQLDASQDADGPDRKPALTKIKLDGHELAIGVDRDRVPTGETIHLTLAALTGGAGEVRVVVQEQTASMDSRMEPPAKSIASTLVNVGAEPVDFPITLAGMLRPDGADPLATAGAATRYTILVVSDTDQSAQAALPVFAYEPEAYRLTVDEPTKAEVGEPCDVTVHVKSLSKKTLTGITIGLSTTFVASSETPVIETLEKGDSATVTIHGTRVEAPEGPLLIQAYGWASYGGTASASATVDRESGALTGS